MKTEYINNYNVDVIQHYEEKRWWLGMTIADILDKNADLYPTKEALVSATGRYSYDQLRALADNVAYGLL
ncbi:MAG: hypothetical protein KJP23_29320, partial [Deltaproteobacteria bacterium]|nr:hypothetical protein [Deltaproteobacteria bacterium]